MFSPHFPLPSLLLPALPPLPSLMQHALNQLSGLLERQLRTLQDTQQVGAESSPLSAGVEADTGSCTCNVQLKQTYILLYLESN